MKDKGTDKIKDIATQTTWSREAEIREDAVARGKKLYEQPGYPDNIIAESLAGILMPYLR